MTYLQPRPRYIALLLLCVSTSVFVATAWHQHQLNRFAENQAQCAHPSCGFSFLYAAYPTSDSETDVETDDPQDPPTPRRKPFPTSPTSSEPSLEDFISTPLPPQSHRPL